MQPMKTLSRILERLASAENYLFSLDDLRCALPETEPGPFKALLSRAQKAGVLQRVCKGVYLYPRVNYPAGRVLFHAAAKLRADAFNYLSLETVLSDAGVISQIPLNWITLMSSGRSHIVDCGNFGHIEFIHTKRLPADIAAQLSYDTDCRLWRASVALALLDMKLTRRSTDLVDWSLVDELSSCFPEKIEKRDRHPETRPGSHHPPASGRGEDGEKAINAIETAIEKSSGNVFADLGLPLPEERLAKAELARHISRILAHRHLTQAAAAELLGIDQPKVSAIMNGRQGGFSMERLLTFLLALDHDIEIRVTKKPRNRGSAHLNVVIE